MKFTLTTNILYRHVTKWSFFFIVSFCSLDACLGQVPAITWAKTFGGPGNDVMQDIYPTADGNYIMLGLTDSTGGDVTCTIKGKHDTWVIKMAPDSTILWQKCFGGSLEEGNPNSKIIQTSDGGYLFQTESWSDDFDVVGHHSASDAWTVKLDENGNKVWAHSFGGTDFDTPRFMLELPGHKYLLMSRTTSQNGDVPLNEDPVLFDAWVFVVDINGTIIRNNIYGGTGDDDLFKAILRADGTLAMFGLTSSHDGDLEGLDVHGTDGWMLVTDTLGNVISSKVYGQANEEDILDVYPTADGGFITFGDTQDPTIPVDKGSYHGDFDFWAMKLDAAGNMQWQGVYGGIKREQLHRGAVSSYDGSYFLSGSTLSTDGDIENEDNKAREYCLMHIAADGSFLWSVAVGGSEPEYCYAMIDGGFVAGGAYSDDGDVVGLQGDADGWVIKFDILTLVQEMESPAGLSIYPNPSGDNIHVNLSGILQPSIVEIKNMFGETLYSCTPNRKEIDINVSSWSSGVYYLIVGNTLNGGRQYVKAFEVVN
ncbi:MAG: T9SS type A sorting domain-containing protein [Chitinophagales bacterium]